MEYCCDRYGDWFSVPKVYVGGHRGALLQRRTFVVTRDPDTVRRFFAAEDQMLARPANIPILPLVGESSLLLMDGERHTREKALLSPPFHGKRVPEYATMVSELTCAALERCPRGRPVAIYPLMRSITLEVIVRVLFGEWEAVARQRFVTALQRMYDAAARPTLMVRVLSQAALPQPLRSLVGWSLRHFYHLRGAVRAMVMGEIRHRRAHPQALAADMLSALVATPMTEGEIEDQMMTLLLTGHETTASALSFVVGRLLQHPEVRHRVQGELLQATDAKSLTYLEAVIKETMRLHPIVLLLARELQKDMDVGPWMLPAGTLLATSSYLTHRHPALWEQPAVFRPERFLNQQISPFAYFPFGGGDRSCLGMNFAMAEMRLILACLLGQFRIRPQPGGQNLRSGRRGVFASPSRGLSLILE